MKNFIQEGNHMDHTPTAALTSGQMVLVGARVGIAIADIPANTPGVLRMTGVASVPKKAADAPAQGALLYWDNTAKNLTVTSSGNTLAGYAFAAAAGADATVSIKLNA